MSQFISRSNNRPSKQYNYSWGCISTSSDCPMLTFLLNSTLIAETNFERQCESQFINKYNNRPSKKYGYSSDVVQFAMVMLRRRPLTSMMMDPLKSMVVATTYFNV